MKNMQTYINYFKGTSITKEDMNYILAVKNMEKLPYNYNLTKVGMVIQRLQPYESNKKVFSILFFWNIYCLKRMRMKNV